MNKDHSNRYMQHHFKEVKVLVGNLNQTYKKYKKIKQKTNRKKKDKQI